VGFWWRRGRWATRNLRKCCAVQVVLSSRLPGWDCLWLREGVRELLQFAHVLDMYVVSITIGEVDNDDAMTRNASFTTHVRLYMRTKKLGGRGKAGSSVLDKIVHVLFWRCSADRLDNSHVRGEESGGPKLPRLSAWTRCCVTERDAFETGMFDACSRV
jgi:hypothetical protein